LLIRGQGLSFKEHNINLLFVVSERRRVIALQETGNIQIGGWLTVCPVMKFQMLTGGVAIILAQRL
jgi:hypothetical protein